MAASLCGLRDPITALRPDPLPRGGPTADVLRCLDKQSLNHETFCSEPTPLARPHLNPFALLYSSSRNIPTHDIIICLLIGRYIFIVSRSKQSAGLTRMEFLSVLLSSVLYL